MLVDIHNHRNIIKKHARMRGKSIRNLLGQPMLNSDLLLICSQAMWLTRLSDLVMTGRRWHECCGMSSSERGCQEELYDHVLLDSQFLGLQFAQISDACDQKLGYRWLYLAHKPN